MKDIFVMLQHQIRTLFEKANTWIVILGVLQLLTLWLIIYVYIELSDSQYHFYMNTKKSLERIHKVRLDSYDGDIWHELTTEQNLIRKQNRSWHLKYMFK